jgi:hypothetical protein
MLKVSIIPSVNSQIVRFAVVNLRNTNIIKNASKGEIVMSELTENILPIKSSAKRGLVGACPRCVKGSIYQEADGSLSCLQCGYRGFPKKNEENVNRIDKN